MDMGSETQMAEELKKVEAITMSDSHSTEQTKSPPNDEPEVTTTGNQTSVETTKERLPEGEPSQEEPSTEPEKVASEEAPTEQAQPTSGEEERAETTASIERNIDAPTIVTPPPDQATRAEPNILDTLDDE